MKKLFLGLGFLLAAIQSAHCTVTIVAQADGLHVTCDSDLLKFTVAYPKVQGADKTKPFKVTETDVTSDNLTTVKYEGGGQIDVSIDSSGLVILKSSNMPPEVKSVQLLMPISLDLNNGSTWQMGNTPVQPFPAAQSLKPHMYQGHAATLTLRSEDGKGITITLPQYAYQEINDLRAWGTQSFGWMAMANYNETLTFKFEDAAPAAADVTAAPAPGAPPNAPPPAP